MPDKIPDAVIRKQRIEEFRELQCRFKEMANAVRKRTEPPSRPEVVRDMQVDLDAGRFLVDCVRRGWLRCFRELDRSVAWLDSPVSDEERTRKARLTRSPYNVFVEFVGNHRITVKNLGDGKVEQVSDPHGGILPAHMPESFEGRPYLRQATTNTTPPNEVGEWNRLDAAERLEHKAKACGLLADVLSLQPVAPSQGGAEQSDTASLSGSQKTPHETPPEGVSQALFRWVWGLPPWVKWPIIIVATVVLILFAICVALPDAYKQKLVDWITKQ